jgi:hypothetical protein
MVHKIREKKNVSVRGIHKLEKEFFEKIKKMSKKELLTFLEKEQPFESLESWDYGDASKFEGNYIDGFADFDQQLTYEGDEDETNWEENLVHMGGKWYFRTYDGYSVNTTWTLLRPKIREPIWTGKWRIKWSPMTGMPKILDPAIYKTKEEAERVVKQEKEEMSGISKKNVERGGIPITTDYEVVKEMR